MPAIITVTRKFSFSYAHHLPEYKGDCAKQHGHNSDVEVEFGYDPNMPPAYPGMIVDFKDISKHVNPIIDHLDHSNLNDLFVSNPTVENICQGIANEILKTPIGPGLLRVQASETNGSFATWRKQ